ncbi:hypothetical protein [Methylorubrum aminovorans]|nr:hypothetical protein [Methylorubrum aminovorans]
MSKFVYGALSFASGALLMLYVAKLAQAANGLGRSVSQTIINENWQITLSAAVMMVAGYQMMLKAKKSV